MRRTSFISTAGVHHVASRLAFEGFRVGFAHGRISHADTITVSLADHSPAATLRVKTSGCATRTYEKNRSLNHYEWDMGRRITQANDPNLFVAFVDLKSMERMPDVFLVPSTELHEYCSSSES